MYNTRSATIDQHSLKNESRVDYHIERQRKRKKKNRKNERSLEIEIYAQFSKVENKFE